MRAAVLSEFHKPFEIKTLPDPRPGPGQVLVRVRASGLCHTDLAVQHGHLPVKMPCVAGHEPAGEIVELGPGVTDLKVGDRVGTHWFQKGCGRCIACQSGRVNGCASAQTWMDLGGGNSELMLAWASGCALIPDGVSFEQAAPIFCAGYTSLRPGERVAVLGTGGLGHLAVQFSRALGLETLAITGQADKKAELRGLGAGEVLVVEGDVGKGLQAAGGADVILSTTTSAKQVAEAFGGLRAGGRLVNMGLTDGPIVLDSMAVMFPPRQLLGSTQDERADLIEALQLVARGAVKPMVETYPLAQINAALDRLASSKVRYRAVLLHDRA